MAKWQWQDNQGVKTSKLILGAIVVCLAALVVLVPVEFVRVQAELQATDSCLIRVELFGGGAAYINRNEIRSLVDLEETDDLAQRTRVTYGSHGDVSLITESADALYSRLFPLEDDQQRWAPKPDSN